MANKITLETIEQYQHQVERKLVTIKDVFDKEYEVEIDNVFVTSKIEKIHKEILEIIAEIHQQTDISEKEAMQILKLLPLLTIREFTDVPIPEKLSFIELVGIVIKLSDGGILEAVHKELPKKELRKIENNKDVNQQVMNAAGQLALVLTNK
ncbi:hypothetical protein [Paenibacillus sp. LK1]|uniref:hypothetical protein n=1 Tax=Paenibacillus sp. LK1 TaxID=2053014 RepID=UPI000C180B0C|nr:hypothetical protein [Paenibacillus sp. LK1]PIH59674.1 hypothetical protein CS562_06970 [Paenibacillus sp. LK1]